MTGSEPWIAMTENGVETNVVELAKSLIEASGQTVEETEGGLLVSSCGLLIGVRGLHVEETEKGIRTVTGVSALHPDVFPEGLFEYQHGFGADLRSAVDYGLRQWAALDLPVLIDAVRDQPGQYMSMELELPAEGDRPPRKRRVILGPTAHYMSKPPAEPRYGEQSAPNGDQAHDFCPCCLTTNAMEAFQPLFHSDDVIGVRLFAARDAEGNTSADCRINGEDYPAGIDALAAYAGGWPDHGTEFRKQYAIYRTVSLEDVSSDGE